MNVLEKVKKLQAERGWTTYKLSLESGITQSTLSNMFSRGTCPSIETLVLLCDAFGISLSEFFSEGEKSTYLSDSEKELICKYRSLPKNEKDAVIAMIKSLNSK